MKRRKRIRPEELSLEIAAALKDYSIDVTDEIKKTVKQVAKEAAKELKETSPKHTGEYAKGWKTKVTNETNLDLTVTIYNAKKPGLAHLLEFGHARVNGGRVGGKEHIYPAKEHAEEKLKKMAEVAVKRRGKEN